MLIAKKDYNKWGAWNSGLMADGEFMLYKPFEKKGKRLLVDSKNKGIERVYESTIILEIKLRKVRNQELTMNYWNNST